MAPIMDPRFAAKRRQTIEAEQEESQRDARLEYIKPLIMLVVGAGGVITWYMVSGGVADEDGERISGFALAVTYLIVFAISLACGVLGLWIASKLWLGGVGYLGLSIIRLAGVYAVTDFVGMVVSPLPMLGWIIKGVVYISLLMWLFELEPGDSILLAVITFAVKVLAGIAIMMIMLSA